MELTFILKSPLQGPGVTVADVLAATDYIVPALEILDTRILHADPASGKTRTIVNTISDNAANAGIITDGRAMRPDAFDPRWAGAIVTRNGEVEETGLGAGVLNDPALAVAWLANRFGQYGQHIEAGQIVLSGSFIRPIEARHGDTILADFGRWALLAARALDRRETKRLAQQSAPALAVRNRSELLAAQLGIIRRAA